MIPTQRGYLMPIGGAERRKARPDLLEQFVELAGNSHSRIVVIPAASSRPRETGQQYLSIFRHIGCADVECLYLDDPRQANDPARVQLFDGATGVFMTGGDQVKLLSLLDGTAVAARIMDSWAAGAAIGGTSAGASAMSKHMIAFGRSGIVPAQHMLRLARGLGLAEGIIIDQHFQQRQRIGRLMTAVANNPTLLGMGLDEDTACIIGPDNCCTIAGSGTVTVVDGSRLSCADRERTPDWDPLAVLDVQIHILKQGYGYDLTARAPFRLN